MLSEEVRNFESEAHLRPYESVSPSGEEPQEMNWDSEAGAVAEAGAEAEAEAGAGASQRT